MAQLLSLVFSALGDKGDAFGVKTKKEPSSKKNAERPTLLLWVYKREHQPWPGASITTKMFSVGLGE